MISCPLIHNYIKIYKESLQPFSHQRIKYRICTACRHFLVITPKNCVGLIYCQAGMHRPLYILYAESNFLVLSPWSTKNISYTIFHQVTQYMNKTARVELANQVPENSSWEQSLSFAVTVRKKVFFMLTATACCIYEHYTQEHYAQECYYRKNCLAAKSLSIALHAPVGKGEK